MNEGNPYAVMFPKAREEVSEPRIPNHRLSLLTQLIVRVPDIEGKVK